MGERQERVLAAVERAIGERNAKRVGSEIKFTCPNRTGAHAAGDEHPSARWKPERQGWFCDVCRDGGGYVELAKALRLPEVEAADEPPPPRRPQAVKGTDTQPAKVQVQPGPPVRQRETARWPLCDATGTVLAVHVRLEPDGSGKPGSKACIWQQPDGTKGLPAGMGVRELPLYGMSDLGRGDVVVVTEGEKATDALRARGMAAVGTVCGAGAIPTVAVLGALRPQAAVVLWTDADKPGRQHMAGIGKVLGGLYVPWALYDPWAPAEDKRDAADWTASTADLEVALRERARAARQSLPWLTLVDVVEERIEWLWRDWLVRGMLNLLEGPPGVGKSAITLDLAARVTTGRPMPREEGSREPAGVVLIGAEDHIAATVKPRLAAMGADMRRVAAFPLERLLTFPTDFGLLRGAIHSVEAVLVVIDPLAAFVTETVNMNSDQAVRRGLLVPLSQLAHEMRVALLSVRHHNKATGGPAVTRGGGSVGITGAHRSVLVANKDPVEEGACVLASVKSNLGPRPQSIRYHTQAHSDEAVVIVWGGESLYDADDLSLWQDRATRTQIMVAVRMVRELLVDGPMAVKDLNRTLRAANLKLDDIRLALKHLFLVPYKTDLGDWMVALPTLDTTEAPKPMRPAVDRRTGEREPGDDDDN